MAELNKKDLISDEAIEAPLILAANFDKVLASLLGVIENGKTLNKSLSEAKGIKQVTTETKKLTKNQTELDKVEKRLLTANQRNNKEYIRKAAELKKVQRETRDAVNNETKLTSAYDKQSKRLLDLRKAYKDVAFSKGQNSKEAKRLLAELQPLDKKLKEVDASTGQYNRNVGNYQGAIDSVLPLMGSMGMQLGMIKTQLVQGASAMRGFGRSTQRSGKLFKVFNTIMKASIIGVIVAGLAGLVAILNKTQGGLDGMQKMMNAVNAVVDVLIDRLIKVGEAFKMIFSGNPIKGFKMLGEAFKGVGKEIKDNIKLSNELTDSLQENRKNTASFIVERARLRAEIQKTRLASRDENIEAEERLRLLQKAFELEEVLAQKRQGFMMEEAIAMVQGGKNAEDRVKAEQLLNDVMEGRTELTLENLGATESTLDDLEEVNEALAEIIGFQGEQYDKQRSLMQDILRLQREIEASKKKESEIISEDGEDLEKTFKDMDATLNGLAEAYDISAKAAEESEARRKAASDEAFEAIAENLRKEAKLREEAERRKEEMIEATAFKTIDFADQVLSNQVSNIQNELDLLRASTDAKLELAEGNEEGQRLIRERAAREEKKLRQEQAEAERRQAIFQILVSTGIGIMRAVQQFGLPLATPFIIAAGALGASQIAGLPPIPQFEKGTDYSPEGAAIINEKGTELLEKNGKYSMVESDGATLTYLQRGTKVHTAEETQRLLASGAVSNISMHDKPASNSMDAKIYNELKKVNKGLSSQKSYNSYLDGQKISGNVRRRNEIRNKVINMNRY